MALYLWLDRLIWLGYNLPHLPLDKLPPLADYDRTKNLVKNSYKVCLLDMTGCLDTHTVFLAPRPLPDTQQASHIH